MSLMQLLTVGHSFMDVKDAPSPYRVNRRGVFPRFVSTPAGKGPVLGPQADVAEGKPAKTGDFIEQNQTLMTPETGHMASAASEATVPASSELIIQPEPLAEFPGAPQKEDRTRPRVKLREGQAAGIPGTVVVKRNEQKVFNKLGLGRLYWPAWMFSCAVVEPNRRRGTRAASRQPVRVVRNSLSLSDVEIVAASPKKAGRAGWKSMSSQAWNWLTGSWRGGGSRRG